MKIKTVGVVGAGSIGARHAYNLAALGYNVLVNDTNETVNLQNLKMCNYPDLLRRSDALVYATPTKHHETDLMAIDRVGKPAFMEKPISNQPSFNTDNVIMVGYNLRFHPCVIQAKDWLPTIGTPLWAAITCAQKNDKPDYLRDGVTLNWSHEIDLALYLLGPAQVMASSMRFTDNNDDIAQLLLRHENGCRSIIHLDYVSEPETRGFTIQGTRGRLVAGINDTGPIKGIGVQDTQGNAKMFFDASGTKWDDAYVEEMKAFINRAEGKETKGCTAAEALDVLKICLDAKRQARAQEK